MPSGNGVPAKGALAPLILIVMAIALAGAGCAGREPGPTAKWTASLPSPESVSGLGLSETTLPFVAARPLSGGATGLALGYWDLAAGLVHFDASPLGFVAGQEVSLSWDGGTRVGVVTPSGLAPSETHTALSLVALSPSASRDRLTNTDKAVFPSHGDTLYAVSADDDGNGLVLEVHPGLDSPGRVRSRVYRLESPEPTLRLLRVVDIAVVDGRLELVAEAVTAELGAVLCPARLEDERLVWDDSIPLAGVTEIGAGTTMARLGRMVYVGEQDGAVLAVDLESGTVTQASALTAFVGNFLEAHGWGPDCLGPTPPSLYGYRGTLVVEVVPNDPVHPSAYLLAVRRDMVVGEIVWADGFLTVRKDGQTTLRAVLTPSQIPPWTFPQDALLSAPSG